MSFQRGRKEAFYQHKDILIFILLITTVFLGFYNSCSRSKEYVLTSGKNLESPELDLFCSAFIDQIINKSLHEEMVENDIYQALIEENYKILNLVGSERRLFSRSQEQDCAVIIQDKIGLRRFDVRVNKSFEYPFFYKVQRVDEPKVEG